MLKQLRAELHRQSATPPEIEHEDDYCRLGPDANLHWVRTAQQCDNLDIILAARHLWLRHNDETLLAREATVRMVRSGDDDSDNAGNAAGLAGTLWLTKLTFTFYATAHGDGDVSAHPRRIALFALSDDTTVYVQLATATDNADASLLEVHVTLEDAATAQEVYDALTKQVRMHPVVASNDDDGGGVDDDNDDGGMIWAAAAAASSVPPLATNEGVDDEDDGETNEEKRTAMLAQLDAMLEVPPSLQVHQSDDRQDGQYSDADEGDPDSLL